MQRGFERLFDRADDQAAHQTAIAKAHLGLGGMDVDVDLPRVAGDEQDRDGMAALREIVEIGGAQGAGDQLVAGGAGVDEEILRQRVGLVEGRQADIAGEAHALAQSVDAQRVGDELLAQGLTHALALPRFARPAGRPVEGRADVAGEGKARLRTGEREPAHDLGAGLRFASVGLEEFQPRRRRREEIARLDARSPGMRGRTRRAFDAVLDAHLEGLRRAARAGADFEPRNRGDRRQRLAAKPQRRDRREIAVGNFRGGVTLDREREIVGVHAEAVVADPDQASPARLDRDVDARRAGVERVLDQLLDRRRRPLDHLARGDAVDQQRVEAANGHAPISARAAMDSSRIVSGWGKSKSAPLKRSPAGPPGRR